MPFVHPDVGEMVARHGEEGPLIDVVVKPMDTEQHAEFSMYPAEARKLADELYRLAELTQRAGWSPVILADARERYLPGMTDEQIIERLDRLYERWGGFVIGYAGRLDFKAGRVLAVEVQVEALDRALAAMDEHADVLSGIPDAAPRLGELRSSLQTVKKLYAEILE